jgi:hypothetical protein
MTDQGTQPVNRITDCSVLAWEIAGMVFIAFGGSALHFAFAWTGYWRPAAIFAAVNESTWEHLKIGFWPMLVWALIEYPFLRRHTNNFWIAKSAALLTLPLVIVVLFYGYTAITGHHYLIADATIFMLAIVAGQLLSYRLLLSAPIARQPWQSLAAVPIAVLILAYSLLTYYPPRNFLFEHSETGEYGILESYEGHGHSSGDHGD